jgi:acetyltransferase-like isoleucine patch superfamily enzyme
MNQTINPGKWEEGEAPQGVILGENTLVIGRFAFKRFRTARRPGLTVGARCTMDNVQFAIGEQGAIFIGDCCYFTNVVLLCETELRIGNYVAIGWNTVIADSDFHPIDPAKRLEDAIACSPLNQGHARPSIAAAPVIIEDDVWIGPGVTILKGVKIGPGAWIEPGSLITKDVPARSRVMGNPAQIIGQL